jgi:hypothetical protein
VVVVHEHNSTLQLKSCRGGCVFSCSNDAVAVGTATQNSTNDAVGSRWLLCVAVG